MRQCRFCDRWFKSRQSVRAHLAHCSTYQAIPFAQRTQREQVFRCEACVEMLGPDFAAVVTHDEMHEMASAHGGCLTCGTNGWRSAGWRRVGAST